MGELWLTADLHIGHAKLVDGFGVGCRGPRSSFADSIEEHDEQIIANYNALVKPGDKVYILGDVALSKAGLERTAALHGQKRIVMGNHDQGTPEQYARLFKKICGAKVLDGMLMTHVPVHPSALTRKSMQVNVHGHTHDERVKKTLVRSELADFIDPRYFCVSLEQNNYRPFHIDEVKAAFGDYLK